MDGELFHMSLVKAETSTDFLHRFFQGVMKGQPLTFKLQKAEFSCYHLFLLMDFIKLSYK